MTHTGVHVINMSHNYRVRTRTGRAIIFRAKHWGSVFGGDRNIFEDGRPRFSPVILYVPRALNKYIKSSLGN